MYLTAGAADSKPGTETAGPAAPSPTAEGADALPGAIAAPYVISCFHCKAPFYAVAAPWCSCLASRRTLVCPSCSKCFCQASQAYKRGVWENAPQSLWDRATEQHQPFEPPELPAEPDSLARPLVLIVEDEPDIQRIALRTIESLGYGAVVARDGEEGIRLARSLRPDLILSDAMMPKLDGREMCRRIKGDPSIGRTPVVIMTSLFTAPRYKYEAYKDFHADDYLSKPLDVSRLQAVLQKFLDPAPLPRT
jgi:CheY-like chemotaxis protein